MLLFKEEGEFLGDGKGKGKGKEGRKTESRKARGTGEDEYTGARYRTEACKHQKQDPNAKKAITPDL